jgi:hypothetical protein
MSKKYEQIVARIERLEEELGLDSPPKETSACNPINLVSSFDKAVHALKCASVPCSYTSMNDEMENIMNTETSRDFREERRVLSRALYDAKENKVSDLKKVYNIEGPIPRTVKEKVSLIQSGKFKFADNGEHADNPDYYYNLDSGLIWVDPEKEPNYEDFHKACEKIEKDRDDALLEVSVLEPEDALKSVKKFKERTYH